MEEFSNRFKLIEEIVALSESTSWALAKLEWELEDVEIAENFETCLCGHFPIKELCKLRNRLDGNDAIVGNVCVKKFLELPSENIFAGLRRVIDDPNKALNEAASLHAFKKSWINDWEKDFCLNTKNKRLLSDKQAMKRLQINARVIGFVKNQNLRGSR